MWLPPRKAGLKHWHRMWQVPAGAGRGGGKSGGRQSRKQRVMARAINGSCSGAAIAAALASLQNAEFAYKVKLKMPVGMEKKTPKPKL